MRIERRLPLLALGLALLVQPGAGQGFTVPGLPPITGTGGGHTPGTTGAEGGPSPTPHYPPGEEPEPPGPPGPPPPKVPPAVDVPTSTGSGGRPAVTMSGQGPSRGGAPVSGAPSTPVYLGTDPDRWQIWWDYNQDRFFDLRAAIYSAEPATGDDEFYLGDTSGRTVGASRHRPTAYDVRERIVPLLLGLLAEDTSPDVTIAALLALGRIGEDPTKPNDHELQDAIVRFLGHSNRVVSEIATISLGTLASPNATTVLASILGDTREGRKLCGLEAISERQRAFAAYGLGLTGHETDRPDVARYAVHYLVSTLEDHRTATHDVEVACALALGLIDIHGPDSIPEGSELPPSASRSALVLRLLELFDDPNEERLLRAHLPVSMARLIGDEDGDLKELVGERLVKALGKRSAEKKREVRHACVLALGRIGDADEDELDAAIRETLMRLSKDGDAPSKRFAAIALADVGSRRGRGNGSPLAASVEVRRFLLKELARGSSNVRPWYGLALGILGGRLLEQGKPMRPEEVAALRESLAECHSTEYAGAYALGAAILGDPMASEALLEKLEEIQDDVERGHHALALGLLGGDRAVVPLRKLMRESLHRPEVLRQTSTALTLIGDKTVVAELVALLNECDCELTRAGIATALGFSGDRTAIDALVELTGREQTPTVRAAAAIALGRVADKDEKPWASTISIGLNYLTGPSSLTSSGEFGIADLR